MFESIWNIIKGLYRAIKYFVSEVFSMIFYGVDGKEYEVPPPEERVGLFSAYRAEDGTRILELTEGMGVYAFVNMFFFTIIFFPAIIAIYIDRKQG